MDVTVKRVYWQAQDLLRLEKGNRQVQHCDLAALPSLPATSVPVVRSDRGDALFTNTISDGGVDREGDSLDLSG